MDELFWYKIVTVLVGLLISSQAQNCNIQQMFEVFPENTPLDTFLFNLSLPGIMSGNIALDPKLPGSIEDGYLELNNSAESTFSIVLKKELNLRVLNPRGPMTPDTNEKLSCDYNSTQPAEQPIKQSLDYVLTCKGSDDILVTASVTVGIIEINDNPPFFFCSPYQKDISELTPVGSTIFLMKGLAADEDVTEEIAGYDLMSNGEGAFDQIGGVIDGIIVSNTLFDFDYGQRQFVLDIRATDTGEPRRSNMTHIVIDILDGDDQNPVFDKDIYVLELMEEDASIVGTQWSSSPPVNAYDLDFGINATIEYQIESGHFHHGIQYFDMNQTTGDVIALQVLDREDADEFILYIKAYQVDNPVIRTARSQVKVVVIDVNDHDPIMHQSKYRIDIPENFPNGLTLMTVSAFDKDEGKNALIQYFINDTTSPFDLDPDTGVITVMDSLGLDREAKESHHIWVYAKEINSTEMKTSEKSQVIIQLIDVNDNNPIFSQQTYEFDIMGEICKDDVIGQVHASDMDFEENGQILYNILYCTDQCEMWLDIDPSTGAIVAASNEIFHESLSIFLTLEAQDQSIIMSQRRSSVCHVLVHIEAVLTSTHDPETHTSWVSVFSFLLENTSPASSDPLRTTAETASGQRTSGPDYTDGTKDPNLHSTTYDWTLGQSNTFESKKDDLATVTHELESTSTPSGISKNTMVESLSTDGKHTTTGTSPKSVTHKLSSFSGWVEASSIPPNTITVNNSYITHVTDDAIEETTHVIDDSTVTGKISTGPTLKGVSNHILSTLTFTQITVSSSDAVRPEELTSIPTDDVTKLAAVNTSELITALTGKGEFVTTHHNPQTVTHNVDSKTTKNDQISIEDISSAKSDATVSLGLDMSRSTRSQGQGMTSSTMVSQGQEVTRSISSIGQGVTESTTHSDISPTKYDSDRTTATENNGETTSLHSEQKTENVVSKNEEKMTTLGDSFISKSGQSTLIYDVTENISSPATINNGPLTTDDNFTPSQVSSKTEISLDVTTQRDISTTTTIGCEGPSKENYNSERLSWIIAVSILSCLVIVLLIVVLCLSHKLKQMNTMDHFEVMTRSFVNVMEKDHESAYNV